MQNNNIKIEKNTAILLKSVEDFIKQKINPYYISEIENAVKISLNPQTSQNEVNNFIQYIILFFIIVEKSKRNYKKF